MPDPPRSLYPFQEAIIDEIQENLKKVTSLLTTAPTGTGKTVILAEIIARALKKGNTVDLLVHREELVTQSENTITIQTGQPPGVVWQTRKEWNRPVTVIAQDTVANLEIPKSHRPKILMVDEAHHTVAITWLSTIDRLNPRYLLGFTATPFRQDKEPLSPKPFEKVIRPVTPKELIETHKALCPALIESPVLHDEDGYPQPISQARNLEYIYLQTIKYAIAQNRSRILLYVSHNNDNSPLQVMDKTTQVLRDNGIPADSISQKTSTAQRQAAFARFKSTPGPAVLLNYITLTEGTDLPHVDCIIIGRRTSSESTIIQMIGRGLRLHPNKLDCLVIAYTDRPDMDGIIHYWRLDEPPDEEPESKGKRKQNKANQLELMNLASKFANELSPLDRTKVQYPWFEPFQNRPLLALPLWSGPEKEDRYITVEPQPAGRWRVTTLNLNRSGLSPITKKQQSTESQEEAAALVRTALGNSANQLERTASWRLRDATPAQIRAWNKHQPETPEAVQPNLTAGEVSDTIARARFIARVNPRVL